MIAIIKYNAGNILSVQNAVERWGFDCMVTDDEKLLRSADKVIFPGVGEAGTAMQYLKEKGLDKVIPTLKQPVLGICLGLQLMCKSTEEGNTIGLGIFDTVVKKFPPLDIIPHMGWNTVKPIVNNIFISAVVEEDYYFIHSYYAELCAQTIAACDYIIPFSSVLQKDNFLAVQFHPEKSSSIGEILLNKFLQS